MPISLTVSHPDAMTIDAVPARKPHDIGGIVLVACSFVLFAAGFVVEARNPVFATADVSMMTGP